jgi:amino acid adenylation domain-containing protein
MKRVSRQAGGIRSPFGPVVNVMPFLAQLDLDTAVGTLEGGIFGAPDEAMVSVFTDGSVRSDLFVRIDAPTELYSPSEVRALGGALGHYVAQALSAPGAPIGGLELTPESRTSTLSGYTVPDDAPVDLEGVLTDHAVRRPADCAVTDGRAVLSHSALADQVRDVRRLLRGAGVRPGDVVALAIPPCLSLVPVQLGLLLSGAVTAPLAPGADLASLDVGTADAPDWLVSLAGMDEVVVTPVAESSPMWGSSVTSADPPTAEVPTDDAPAPSALCYVAAGISLTHSGLHALVRQVVEGARIGPNDTVLVRHGGWELLCAVVAGAPIVVRPRPSEDPAATVAFLSVGELAEWAPGAAAPQRMRAVVYSREPIPTLTRQAWVEAGGGALTMGWAPAPTLPPFALTTAGDSTPVEVLAGRIAVLDDHALPLGHGFSGRLHAVLPATWASADTRAPIDGPSSAPASTEGRSVAIRLPVLAGIEHDGLRVWGDADRTMGTPAGKLCLPDVDRAVETTAGVAEAASRIVPADDPAGQPRLTLYVVPDGGGLLSGPGDTVNFDAGLDLAAARAVAGALVAGLATVTDVVVVGDIPRTVDGLPRTDDLPLVSHMDVSRAPSTEQEHQLADLFRQVLGRPEVGAGDDFFQLGGDSIMAMRLSASARRAGLELSVRDVFEHRTVESLAAHVTPSEYAPQAGDVQVAAPREYPLPPAAFVFDRSESFDRFAQWMALTTPPDLVGEELGTVLQHLLDRHDALRSRRDGSTMTVSEPGALAADQVLDVVVVPTPPAELEFAELRAYAAAAVAHIDARNGDLVRFVWLDGPEGLPGLLVCVFHHLVTDGVSWQVVLDDLPALHKAVATGRDQRLKNPPVAFAEWTHHVHDAAGAASSEGPSAWTAVFEGLHEDKSVLDPELDVVNTSDAVHLTLDPSLSAALGSWVAERLDCGIEDLLLATYVTALPESSVRPVVVRMEGHGRDGALPDGREPAQTLGWFTTVYPLRVDVSDLASLRNDPGQAAARAVSRVRRGREILPRDVSSYALDAYAPRETGRPAGAPRADRIGFNYLGRFGVHNLGDPWTPAARTPVIVPAPDPRMPLASVLNLDIASVETDGTEAIAATFSFATRHLDREAVAEVAERWLRSLTALRDLAADSPNSITGALVPHVSGREWADLTRHYGRLEDIWPLTPLQHGLYYHWLHSDSAADAYQLQFAFTLEGPVDADRLGAAVEMTVRRLPNLRVIFVGSESGDPLQVVLPASEASVPFSVVDLRPDGSRATSTLEDLLAEGRRSTFDLATAPPVRFTLYVLGEDRCCLSLTAHHILLDGWSLPLLLTEILRAYAQGDGYDTTEDTRFRSTLRRVPGTDEARGIAPWQAELRGLDAPLLAETVTPGEEAEGTELGDVEVDLPRDRAIRVAATAAALGVTTNVLLQAAWALTVSMATGSEDIAFGNTVAVRPNEVEGSEECIGMLTNTVPVRVRVGLDLTLSALAKAVQDTSLRMMDHWDVGLGKIVAATSRQELFDSIVVFESFPIDHGALREASQDAGLAVTGIRPYAPTHYPFTLLAAADPVLSATIQYRGGPARRQAAQHLAAGLSAALCAFVDNSATRVAEIERVTSAELQRLVQAWNETEGDYARVTVAEQFAHRAQQTPDNVAVIHGERSWTYADLAREAACVREWLQDTGVRRGDKVAVAVTRSMSCLAAILGIWQARAVYVPVDPALPASRVDMILEDSAPVVVITPDVVDARPWGQFSEDHRPIEVTSADDAYAFFTSGSTGRPQGVLVGHDALANFLDGMQRIVEVTEADRWLSVTTISFDISLLELFQPLVRGAAVVIAPDEERTDPEAVWRLVRNSGVTTMQATPSLWRGLCTEAMSEISGLRALVGGEALDGELAARLIPRADTVVNVYGPTETTIWSTSALLPQSGPPSIGRPILNTQVYVLDRALRPLPVGEIGELWIAGAGLATGYFNSSRLTAARFVANPFSDRSGERMYRTGDLARWTADGEIEFLGRNDTQVKLRGMRIELTDVERLLVRHPDVRQAQVCLQGKDYGPARLVAYLVLQGPDVAKPRDFAAFLEREVPEHMRPAVTVVLDAFPLTPNGKIDRKRLPEPEAGSDSYVAPTSGLQTTLCRLFAEALGVDRVGVRDEFVASGGHSLIATRLVSRIRTELGVEVPIQALFAAQTVDELSALWDEFGSTRRRAITRITKS